MLRPALKPAWMRSSFHAPRFWAAKLLTPLPRVVKEVVTRLLSFTAAE